MTVATNQKAQVDYLLRLADGALILSQRLGEWCGHAPVLEEDIAFTNIALDLLGQARLLYTHAGKLEGRKRDEDAFAYWRNEGEYLNPTLVELPNGDFAQSVLRAYLYVEYQAALWGALKDSTDRELVAISVKSAKETRYHVEHLSLWVCRLGDGTDESHQRMQRALNYLWPYCTELMTDDTLDKTVAEIGLAPLPSNSKIAWLQKVEAMLTKATLKVPPTTPFRSTGKEGRHSEHLGYVLAELQSLARAHPGAKW
jgi:ring-1,2-phenylacetyl-CoA epoxidase subunit PaaC